MRCISVSRNYRYEGTYCNVVIKTPAQLNVFLICRCVHCNIERAVAGSVTFISGNAKWIYVSVAIICIGNDNLNVGNS